MDAQGNGCSEAMDPRRFWTNHGRNAAEINAGEFKERLYKVIENEGVMLRPTTTNF